MISFSHAFWKLTHKVLNALVRLPVLSRLAEHPATRRFREQVLTRYVTGLPDRRYWDETIMPALLSAGLRRILFVGCGSYTHAVHRQFEAAGIECWTLDIVPENAAWGNPKRHLARIIHECVSKG